MQQPSLFSSDFSPDSQQTTISFEPTFTHWQAAAREVLRDNRAPDTIWWNEKAPTTDRVIDSGVKNPRPTDTHGVARVPRSFLQQAKRASYHSNSDRWALLYSLLWRLTHNEPALLDMAGDREVTRLRRYVDEVNRDIHKTKAFVRFRRVNAATSNSSSGSVNDSRTGSGCHNDERYVAWFEPSHNTLPASATFFRNRFANRNWSILTPAQCVHWDTAGSVGSAESSGSTVGEGQLWFSEGTHIGSAPAGDDFEEAWRVYYASIFNPARVKLDAMRAEMPQKYWRNLPEAHLIGALIQAAPERVAAMQRFSKTTEQMNCGPLPVTPEERLQLKSQQPERSALEQLKLAAVSCRACPLHKAATQTVFGSGPEHARIMIIGEQPGDTEDLSGAPFSGPAGKLLNQALDDADIARDALYLTNAVKHFKYRVRGKFRIHESPSVREVAACASWLDAELKLVNPELIVCLGNTAARALLGSRLKVTRDRGRLLAYQHRQALVTYHPSFVLRAQSSQAKTERYEQLVSDLALANSAPTTRSHSSSKNI